MRRQKRSFFFLKNLAERTQGKQNEEVQKIRDQEENEETSIYSLEELQDALSLEMDNFQIENKNLKKFDRSNSMVP